MSFNIALTGLTAANEDLSVTSNNLANAATIGFKGARAEFSDLFAASQLGVGSVAIGNGVAVNAVTQQFSQGNLETTGNSLDLAINGDGFFVLSNNGALNYTRKGEFQLNSAGQVVTSQGEVLQAYPPLANGGFNTGGLSSMSLNTGEGSPNATTTAQLIANLPANAAQPANPTFSPTDPTSYTNTTSLTVYDSLGAAHTASLYFIKTATANDWNAQLYVDGTAVGGLQPLNYNATGQLTTPANGKVAFPAYTPATGALAMNMTFDFGQTTQYGGNFAVSAVQQDGFTTGKLSGINIDQAGVVEAQFTNGRSVPLGQIALANFANPQGLAQLGDASWSATNSSGAAVNGVAGNSGFGAVKSGSLEQSNVDTTAALVRMIIAQRDFQANAQMIQTQDQVTNSIIQIRG